MVDGDPFERAVRREARLLQRARTFDSVDGTLRVVMAFFLALGVLWAGLLVAHWRWLAEPRWLVVLHTVVFVGTAVYYCVTAAFVLFMRRSRPDWFDR